jgi:hypothetical protein
LIPVNNIWNDQRSQPLPCICPKVPSSLSSSKFDERCYRCGKTFHTNCVWGKNKLDILPECPSCYLFHCLPHKPV